MQQKVKIFLDNYLNTNSKLIVAVSGGIDSMVLLHLLTELNYPIFVAHCNFNLRNHESQADEDFIVSHCEQRNIPCFVKSFQTSNYAKQYNLSIQEAARSLRYQWFEKLRLEINADFVLMAHHADDAIETFFINLIRGTGIKGLKSIPAKREFYLRPLIEISRKEIINYAYRFHIHFRMDKSNLDDYYLRNKIRLKLLPLLAEIRENAEIGIKKTIDNIQVAAAIYNNYFHTEIHEVLSSKNHQQSINIPKLLSREYPKNILFEFLNEKKFNANQSLEIFIAAKNNASGKQFFSPEYEVLINRQEIIIIKKTTGQKEQEEFFITENMEIIQKPMRISIKKLKPEEQNLLKVDSTQCLLDASKISFPLKIRKWKKGDYFIPFGFEHKKLISDFYIDKKFSIHKKNESWLLLSNEDICWLIGERADNRFAITRNTKEILVLTLIEEKNDE